MALAAAHAGDLEAAEEALDAAEALGPNDTIVYDADLWHARAVVAIRRRDASTATRVVRNGIDAAARTGRLFDEALGWHLLAQLGALDEAVGHLRDLASRIGGLPAMFAEHAEARLAGDADRLAALSDQAAALGADPFAALVAHHAATAHAAAGRDEDAARWTARAAALQPTSSAELGASLLVTGDPGALSHREWEVAELVASGMPVDEVADRLLVSARTVDDHLAAAMRALGVDSPAELGSALAAAR